MEAEAEAGGERTRVRWPCGAREQLTHRDIAGPSHAYSPPTPPLPSSSQPPPIPHPPPPLPLPPVRASFIRDAGNFQLRPANWSNIPHSQLSRAPPPRLVAPSSTSLSPPSPSLLPASLTTSWGLWHRPPTFRRHPFAPQRARPAHPIPRPQPTPLALCGQGELTFPSSSPIPVRIRVSPRDGRVDGRRMWKEGGGMDLGPV